MGVGRREPTRLWALALALALAWAQHTGGAQLGSAPSEEHPHLPPAPQGPGGDALRGVTILPPLRTAPVVRALDPAHSGRVCSTWGDFHYKTFDGDVFRFPGRCNYVFAAHCGAAYEDFNVQLRRGPDGPAGVTMKLRGLVLQLTPNSVLVNGRPTQLPFSQSGVLVEHSANYLKVVARLGLVFMWNQDGSLLLELDAKYANQTCGLCGDFNGVPVFDEFFSRGTKLSAVEFGNLQKLDGPTEQCQDPAPAPPGNCSIASGLCEELLLGERFLGCHALVDAGSYVRTCRQDLCLCQHADLARCVCHTLAEFSRQCAHAGGLPPDWRGPGLCSQTCPHNMRYRECGSPCADTCSNREHSQLCEDHCVAGCFCPEGMVLDDIGQTGCIPVSQCPCVHSGATYAPGATYSTDCTNCTCSGGRWSCQEVPCPGTCAVLGGAHFSTFDERPYTVHGDCSYVLAKPCNSSAFTVLAELRRCGLTDSETCLRSLTLSLDGGRTVVEVKASGEVLVNQLVTQLPISTADITLFRPSTFFIVAQTHLGLQVEVQLVPSMQVFLRAAPALRGRTCGLCGNFNQNQADDFRALSGVVEGTAAAFANTWKTQAACPNVRGGFEDPCSLSVENEKYAQHWCSGLTDPQGPFAPCHAAVSPGPYFSNCLFDTCNCEKSEDCLCAALSAYVRACAARGVLLGGWRAGVCTKPVDTCPPSMTYHYHVRTCQPTCRALSGQDPACGVSFVPVDGCACPDGTFLDDAGTCVPAASCPCYHGDTVVPNGESLHEQGAVCTCTQGTLTCIGGNTPEPACAPPMVHVDCRNATPGAGAGCQKSCHTLDMDCYSAQCLPGCVCPAGLVADGEGGCVAAEDCPCVHNEASYRAGQTIRVGCNTCTCKNRKWQCTDQPCLGTCAVYGDGHYLTFDGQRYSFNGACEYTLLQDHCGGNGSAQDAFRVVTENVPCGTTGTTCSKAIKIFLGSYELKLSEGQVEVIEKGPGREAPYSIRQVGIYLVVDTEAGLVLLWDKKTSIFLRLSPEFKGRVCGLCGNFDDNAVNDFTTRSRSVVGDALEFGNSWKFSPTCPDAPAPRDPCTANPYRKSWAQRQCSLLNSATFRACHAHVEPAQYYEACVSDACACDSGGDCECFCTAVAAYAQACRDAGVCVAWRTPEICPLFCDYYNPEGQCEWHYQPCGAPCLRTCRNPRGQCLHDTRGLEGCYPKCPPEAPIFDEDAMRCVATCPTPPPPPPCQVQGKSYRPGAAVPSDENCHSCICTENGVRCVYDAEACVCSYDGRRFRPGDVIYHTTDGTGGCISARCGPNGTIARTVHACSASSPAPPTTFSFSSSTPPSAVSSTGPPGPRPRPATSPAPASTPRPRPSTASVAPGPACGEDCLWSAWLDVSRPGRGLDSGDFDTLDNLRAHGDLACQAPRAVECRAERAPDVPLQVLGQHVECSPTAGLTCYNRDQASGLCDNYQIRVLCCSPRTCPTSRGPATHSTTSTSVPTAPVTTTSPAPVTSTPAPGTSSPAPGTTSPAPGTSSPAPGTSSPAPGTSSPAPGTSSPAPGTSSPAPGTSSPAPGTSSPAPGTSSPAPGTSSPAPGTSSPAPGTSSPAPGTTSPAPGTSTPAPGTSSPAPGTTSPAPGTTSPAPGTSSPAPGTSSPAPGTSTPAPGTSSPAPGTSSPAPGTTSSPAPGTSSPAPGTTTPAPGTSTPAPGTSSPVKTTCASPRPMPGSSTASTTASVSPSAPGVPTTSQPSSSSCWQASCSWTPWLDGSYPEAGINGGDFDTFRDLRAKGYAFCERPSRVECRAERFPDTPLAELGQTVVCSDSVGLLCRNKDQLPPICYNYQIRIECCELVYVCRDRTVSPATSRATRSTPHGTRTQTQAPRTSTQPWTASSVHVPPATTGPPGTHTVTHTCQPQCTWTKWFDVDFPSPGPHGGDLETFSNIVRSGEQVCGRPEYITHLECRARSHPEVSIARLGQVVQCNPDVGLVCHNRDQAGRFKMCLNYEVRVLCCEPRAGCPTFKPVTIPSTPSVSITSPAETTSHVATSSTTPVPATSTTPVPTTSTTPVPATSTTPVPTTSTTPVPATSTTPVPTTSTTPVPTTSTTPVPATSTTPVPATSTTPVPGTSTTPVPATSTTPVPAASTTPVPAASTTSVPTTSTTPVPGTSTTSVPTSTTPVPTSTTPVPATSTTSVPATSTTSVPTTSTTPVPATSTTPVPTTSTTSVPTTSTTPEPTTSTTVPTTSTTTVPTTSTTPVPATSTTPVPTTSTTSVPTTSTTPEPTTSTTVPTTSTTTVPTTSTTPVPATSTTPVPGTSTTSVPATSTTPVPATSTTPVPATSTTPVPATSTSVPTTSTTVPGTSTTPVPGTSTTPVPGTSTTSVPTTSTTVPTTTTPVPATSTTPVPGTSTTSVPTTSTTVPTTSTTPEPATSTTPVPTSTTPVPATSTTPVPGTSTTSVPTTSTTVPTTSTTPVPTTSTTPVPATSTTPVPATSTTPVPAISTTPVPTTSTTVPTTSTTPVPATSTTVPTTSTTPVPATSTTSVPATSTTSAPITSTTSVPAPQTTHRAPGTTSCQPQCTWTKWFDVDFPSPGPHGGDLETFSNIVRSGEQVCGRPEYITHLECRARSHPEVSIARLGQVVQCSPDVGLVCHNRDQAGRFKMCLNYEVRVLCCEPRAGCPLSSVTPYVTSTKSLPTTAPSSAVPTGTASVPPCYCSVSDRLYPAGSIIYQEADLAGHCYYAVCSLDCHVVRQTDHACPTSTPPSTPATLPPGSSPSAPVPVTTPGCPSAVPPRARGETWTMPNCSQATCEGNNVITLGPRPCPQAPEPTCANGYPALKVPDEDGCCLHYQCQCVCSGWGDPHYITFDGTYYTFLDNCTYVLVQQIVPVYGHFRVLIDNYFCDSEDGLSCPQSIIVEYRQERVVLTRKPVRGVMTNEIIFNNKVVSPGFSKGGLVVSQIGIRMYVTIPEIGVQVMFSGLIFSVEVPFSKFANNTEGQCGTCTNDPKDECRLPGGAVVTSCSDMSGYWKVTNPDQPSCHGPPPTRPTVGPTTPPAPCPPSPICELILSDVFEPCHAVIPPRPYFLGCAFDHCHMTNAAVVCSGLELYASLCASHGLCIDWRGRTNHTCPFTCPADKVYQPCGPSNPPYCYGGDSTSLVALQDAGPITEGCFCPEGMTLFSESKDVCVPTGCPRCLGPHGEPVEPGHTVSADCQDCTCEAGSWTLSCRPRPCALPPACPEPGLVPVPASPRAGQCCPQYTCACNTSYCPALAACPEGTRQILTREAGACCPSQKCSWTGCRVNGTLYQPGAVVSSSLCETCRCEVPGGPPSDTFRISCETQTCHTHCPVGFEYRAQSGRCCGACVQVACVMNTSDSSAHLFYPGEAWSEPGNRCETHECEQHQDGLVVVTTKKACPPLSCPADQARLSEDGCCLSCPPPPPQNRSTCAVQHKHQVIRLQGCSSAGPVRLAYCQGNCGDTTSVYSLEAQALEHRCRCCQELRASPRNVTLRCADGSRRAFSYTQVEECGCVGQRCDARGDLPAEEPAPLQRRDPERGRWSRAARALPLAEGRLPPH